MASTTPLNVESSIREVWASEVLREHLVSGFWGKFVGGEGSTMPIVQKTELLDKPGDTIHIQSTVPLSGAGVTGDTTALIGSEENLTTAEILVVPIFYRHGVRWYRRADKKSIVGLREEASMRLAEWGTQKMDALRFASYVDVSTVAANIFASVGGAGTKLGVTAAAGKLTSLDIQTIKLRLTNQKAKPLYTSAGEPVYGLVVHPNVMFDLKRDAEYRDWVQQAHIRGADNPFFKGATAMIDGVVLFEHPNVQTYTATDASKAAECIAFGQGAFVEGVDENVSWDEMDFDYGNEFGIAYKFAMESKRALKLNSLVCYLSAVDK